MIERLELVIERLELVVKKLEGENHRKESRIHGGRKNIYLLKYVIVLSLSRF